MHVPRETDLGSREPAPLPLAVGSPFWLREIFGPLVLLPLDRRRAWLKLERERPPRRRARLVNGMGESPSKLLASTSTTSPTTLYTKTDILPFGLGFRMPTFFLEAFHNPCDKNIYQMITDVC